MRIKVVLVTLASLLLVTRAAPVADPDAFLNLGAVAIPAITGSALIDGLLLGKVAFLKAAILANLLLGQSNVADESAYGPPEIDSYGAPAVSYEEPAPAYGPPATYEEPAPSYEEPAPSYEQPAPSYEQPAPSYEAPVADEYGAPAADPLPSYGAPARAYHRYYQ